MCCCVIGCNCKKRMKLRWTPVNWCQSYVVVLLTPQVFRSPKVALCEVFPAAHLGRHASCLLCRAHINTSSLQAQGLVSAPAFAAVSLLLLPVLHLHQGRDERVLHLFLKLQLFAPSQLADQLLRVLADGSLHPVQQFHQGWAGHQAQAYRVTGVERWTHEFVSWWTVVS